MAEASDLLMATGVLLIKHRSLKRQVLQLKRSRGRIIETLESYDDKKLQPYFEQLQQVLLKLDRLRENLPLEREVLTKINRELSQKQKW